MYHIIDKMSTTLEVRDPWLYYIQIGKKNVECRMGNPSKYAHWVGKKIYFENKERRIPVRVLAVRHYPDLLTYLNTEGFEKVLPGKKTLQAAMDIYHEIYSDEKIREAGGMIALEIKLL